MKQQTPYTGRHRCTAGTTCSSAQQLQSKLPLTATSHPCESALSVQHVCSWVLWMILTSIVLCCGSRLLATKPVPRPTPRAWRACKEYGTGGRVTECTGHKNVNYASSLMCIHQVSRLQRFSVMLGCSHTPLQQLRSRCIHAVKLVPWLQMGASCCSCS